MSRKHYIETARIIADSVEKSLGLETMAPGVSQHRIAVASDIARRLADMFASDNPHFDHQRFYFACALDENGK